MTPPCCQPVGLPDQKPAGPRKEVKGRRKREKEEGGENQSQPGGRHVTQGERGKRGRGDEVKKVRGSRDKEAQDMKIHSGLRGWRKGKEGRATRQRPDGDQCGKLRHRRLRHTDGGQERASPPLRGPQGHCGPCAGIASLSRPLLAGGQGNRPMDGHLSSYKCSLDQTGVKRTMKQTKKRVTCESVWQT